MNYIIDTNIAYYLAGISENAKFSNRKFTGLKGEKFISSVSILELYYKYKDKNIEEFRKILKALLDYDVYIIEFGFIKQGNDYPTIKKLLTKPKSYLNRIIKKFKEMYIDILALNIYYFASMVGGLYTGILELFENPSMKLKDFHFKFIDYKEETKNLFLTSIKDSCEEFWINKDYSYIYYAISIIINVSITEYYIRKNNLIVNTEEEMKSYVDKFTKDNDLNFCELINKLKKMKNYTNKQIFSKFEDELISDNPCYIGLTKIAEFLFENNSFEINSITDSIIISIPNLSDDMCIITFDKKWIEFMNIIKDKFPFTKESFLGRKVRQKVIKKRTVTDWQPHSGMINQELVTSVRLGEPDKLTVYSRDSYSIYIKNDIDFLKMSGAIEDYSKENQKKIKVLTPSNEEKDVAIERGRREIVNCVNLPGDHYKDFTTSVSSKVLSSQIYIVPTWEMNFRYNDEDYYINSLAYDKRFEYCIPTAENEIKSEINSKTTGTFLLSMTASMLAIIASILILFVFKKIEYRYYTLIGIGVSLLFFIIYLVHHKSVTRDVMDDRLEQLTCSLEEILSANKLPALTASEREKILMKWGKK